jgi:hypothetical protein
MKPESPHEVWVGLRSNNASDNVIEIASVPSSTQTGYGPARYALDEAGSPRLLIPCAWIEGVEALPKLGGPSLGVRLTNLHGPSGRALYIDLVLAAPALAKVFAELCQQILSRISNGRNPVESVSSTIGDFRALLADPASQVVTDASVAGLIGELLFLRKITRVDNQSVESWVGPMGQRHDFRTRLGAVEVKTSLRKAATHIHVHGIEQLTPPSDAALWLAHFRIERTSSGRLSVAALYDDVVSMGGDGKLLASRLVSIGCLDPHSPAWNGSAYELESFELYEVQDGFPKLDESSFANSALPAGVSDLIYQVDLSTASDFLLSEYEADRVVGEMSK